MLEHGSVFLPQEEENKHLLDQARALLVGERDPQTISMRIQPLLFAALEGNDVPYNRVTEDFRMLYDEGYLGIAPIKDEVAAHIQAGHIDAAVDLAVRSLEAYWKQA